jgi:hypothetical protein
MVAPSVASAPNGGVVGAVYKEYRHYEMLDSLTRKWRVWRENSRQRQIERALYKAGGGGLPTRQTTQGNAYVPDAEGAEHAAESVGSGSAGDNDRK